MTEIKGIPRVVLLPDEPITDYHADKLDTARFAKVIASAAHYTETPFTIGVFGKWGQGKTSVLKQAESLIVENYQGDVTVWFNAWQFEREEVPIVPLILTIAEKLEKQTNDGSQAKEYLHRTGRILRGIARAVSLSISTPLPVGPKISVSGKELTDEIAKAVEDSPPEILPGTFYVKTFNALTECTDKYRHSTETGNSPSSARVIVFIDDLDRCLPKQAVGLLQGIKLVLSQPGFVFILGLDRQIIEDYLVKIYTAAGSVGTEARENGRRFIDKIIQLSLPLPRQDDLASYIDTLLERSEFKIEGNAPIRDVIQNIKSMIAVGANPNPRNVVRFINNLIVDRALWIATGEDQDLVDGQLLGIGAVSRILREHLGEAIYLELAKSSELCKELSEKVLAGKSVSLDWTKMKDIEKLPSHERLREEILRWLDTAPFLGELLATKFGKQWLISSYLRAKVDQFLHEERGEGEREETELTPSEIVARAIAKGKEIPLSGKGLAKVKALDLSNRDVDNVKLTQVEKLTKLRKLNLDGTKITDAGLVHLGKLTDLQILNLGGTKITDAGLVHLGKLTKLMWLNLYGTEITDAGLVHLGKLTKLMWLNLYGTEITDAGLVHLGKLTDLSELSLGGTKITDAGLKRLRQRLPRTRIREPL